MTRCTIDHSSSLDLRTIDLEALNQRFETAHPKDILAWCVEQIPQGLIQTSTFSVDGTVMTDWLYRQLHPAQPIPVVFLDTLHHFPQTLELVDRVQDFYRLNLYVYKPSEANSREEFADRFGEALWQRDIEQFHYLTKIAPLQRALTDLNVVAWITGRRRDQAASRAHMPIFEQDSQGRLKINPMANWSQKESWRYVFQHQLPYNPLYDLGYASIGDEPLTTPIAMGEDERAGRWRGSEKTECGIHLMV